MIKKIMEGVAKGSAGEESRSVHSPILEFYNGRLEETMGAPRDLDGNVVYVDQQDRPYIIGPGGEHVLVRVYRSRILDRDHQQCTIANPDGKREVLITEPVPVLSSSK